MKQREQAASGYQLASPHATSIPHELIPLLPANWPAEIPLARITTCGPTVSVAVLRQINPGTETEGHPTLVYGPPDDALLEEKGASTALLLLAVLASQPHCSATKDWLSETLGHGTHDEDEDDLDGSPGLKRVDNVATQLRHLLFPPVLRDLPTANQLRRRLVISYRATRESGSGYRLAGLPLLWIDVEAIGEHLKQARALEQFGHDGLPAWQAAYEVAGRGIFLEREPYSDWASWRRQQVETQLLQSVQALWRPLAQQGEVGETEAVRILQSYWQNHITNEDVLRPLIELLGKRECYGQAEEYYAHLCLALEQEDKQPDHRTQEAMTFLRALQIQREPSQYQSRVTTSEVERASLEPPLHAESVSSTSSHGMIKTTIEAFSKSKEEQKQNMDPSRRTITAGLAGLLIGTTPSLEWLERLASPHPSAMNTQAFMSIQQLLETGWALSNAGELHIAEHVLLSFLPRIRKLVPHKQEAASIAAEGLRLHGILAAHQQRMGDKLTICLQAVEYARQAKNLDILVAQLSELAIAFIYARQPINSLRTYQEALLYCEKEQISPLVRSRVYAAAAPTFAKNGDLKEACSFIQKAYDCFPTSLNSEPNAFSADNKPFTIDYYQGLLFLVMKQPEEAYQVFEKAIRHSPENQMPERWRLIILNYQGLASILSNQLEQYAKCLEEGVSCSITLGSKKRYDEAIHIFQHHLPQTWHTEARIKQISERFQLKRQSRREEELEI